jgi:hypothetical protein
MLKQKNQFEDESIVQLIELMIDVRFQMLSEKQYNNYRQFFHLKETQYDPIVENLTLKLSKIGVDFNSGQG